MGRGDIRRQAHKPQRNDWHGVGRKGERKRERSPPPLEDASAATFLQPEGSSLLAFEVVCPPSCCSNPGVFDDGAGRASIKPARAGRRGRGAAPAAPLGKRARPPQRPRARPAPAWGPPSLNIALRAGARLQGRGRGPRTRGSLGRPIRLRAPCMQGLRNLRSVVPGWELRHRPSQDRGTRAGRRREAGRWGGGAVGRRRSEMRSERDRAGRGGPLRPAKGVVPSQPGSRADVASGAGPRAQSWVALAEEG